jgi:hypothetical protein
MTCLVLRNSVCYMACIDSMDAATAVTHRFDRLENDPEIAESVLSLEVW